eukprot:TRINITY_DN350_c0_g1_i1.p1 TRINITY_DN350_c0_g1~~TRINITY_DN350_c0_g1_i1.p1  ORF type:complete len:101 (-),score=5.52 TRINITY_DN350_c0_g1_i1:55-357(-)
MFLIPSPKSVLLWMGAILLSICIIESQAGPIEDVRDTVNKMCLSNSQCLPVQYCDLTHFQCQFTDWFLALIIGIPVVLIMGICICCVCCPACCLYSIICK